MGIPVYDAVSVDLNVQEAVSIKTALRTPS